MGSLRKSVLCCEGKKERLDQGNKDSRSLALPCVLCGTLSEGAALELPKGILLAGT